MRDMALDSAASDTVISCDLRGTVKTPESRRRAGKVYNDPLRLFHFTTDMKMKTMPPSRIQKTTAKSPIPWSERAKADLTHQPDARVARIPRAHLPEPTAAWM